MLKITLAAAAALTLFACSPAEAPTIDREAEWIACVDAAWEADDPSDATLQECDARFGDEWVYRP